MWEFKMYSMVTPNFAASLFQKSRNLTSHLCICEYVHGKREKFVDKLPVTLACGVMRPPAQNHFLLSLSKSAAAPIRDPADAATNGWGSGTPWLGQGLPSKALTTWSTPPFPSPPPRPWSPIPRNQPEKKSSWDWCSGWYMKYTSLPPAVRRQIKGLSELFLLSLFSYKLFCGILIFRRLLS